MSNQNRLFVGFYKTYSNIWYIAVLQFLIRLFTFSKYSHVELFFYDATHGMTFAIGAQTFPTPEVVLRELPMDNSKWEFIELPSNSYDKILQVARTYEGMPYDFIGALASVLPWVKSYNRFKVFCSELVSDVMNTAGFEDVIQDDFLVSPGELHKKLYNKFNK